MGWGAELNAAICALSKLLLERQAIGPEDTLFYVPVFGVGCAMVAALLVFLDRCYLKLKGVSLLFGERTIGNIYCTFLSWVLAATITGTIGLWLGVLQPTIEGCVGAAVSWQALMTIFVGRPPEAPSGGETDEDGGEE